MDAPASSVRIAADRHRTIRYAARRAIHRRLRRRLPRISRGAVHERTHPLRGKQTAVTRELPVHYWSVARLRAAYASGEVARSEEHTSELQSLMRNPYAVFCLKKKTHKD